MKKELTLVSLASFFFIFLFIFVLTLSNLASEIRINEVELNPYDSCNDCTEWIELYSSEEINLNGWYLKDASNKIHYLNFSFKDHIIILNPNISLNNNDEQIFLYNPTELVFSTIIFSDSNNNDKTWQYCSGSWYFRTATKNYENNCTIESTDIQNNSIIDNTNNSGNNEQENEENNNKEDEIKIKFDWNDEEIINNKEFEIEIKASNLENNKYDLKIWIVDDSDNDKIISEIYNEDEEKWQSGNYYLENVLKGSGSDKTKVKLRLKKDYQDFEDETKIYARLRLNNKIICDEKDKINIIKEKENTINPTLSYFNHTEIYDQENQINDLTKINSKVIYDSSLTNKLNYIYYILGFLLIIILLLLIIKRVKIKRLEN